MQIFIHCKTPLHVSGVTALIIRSIKTVPADSGIGHTICTATPLLHGLIWTLQIRPRWRGVAVKVV